MITHAALVPLIGGEVLGSDLAFGSRPRYLASFTPFKSNDQHLIKWYDDEVPYHLVDEGSHPQSRVDVISSTCPCAGLSMLSHGYGDHNENNKWMVEAAEYALSTLKPEVYWGENAPGLISKIGDGVRGRLEAIAKKYGYSISYYKTKSLLHGLSQIRERVFYFFWRGDKTPLLNFFDVEHERIENTIINTTGNSLREPINPKTPSRDDPYYRFILENIHGGISHREYAASHVTGSNSVRDIDVLSYIENRGISYKEVAEWMLKNSYDKEAEKCLRRQAKLDSGGNIMRRTTIIPRDYIGAFVGHYPKCLTHPVEDRYIDYREAMTIMGMPQNFDLIEPHKNYNHICQNVPVKTAYDMASEVIAVLEGKREFVKADCVIQYNNNKVNKIIGERQDTLDAFWS